MSQSRIIVQLRVDLSADEQAGSDHRTKAIARVREHVLQELGGTKYRVTRVYETIPFVALEVSPDALQILKHSQFVVGIEKDTLSTSQ